MFIENGHVAAMTFAVLDTPKESQQGNNGHGSKIIVVPFDGPRSTVMGDDMGTGSRLRSRSGIAPRSLTLAVLLGLLAWTGSGWSLDQQEATTLCRRYLASSRRSQRQDILQQLADYHGSLEPIVQRLAARSYPSVEPGYNPAEHFSTAALRKKHPADLLYFVVPEDYRRDRPTGLIVFLHGGGKHTSPRGPGRRSAFRAAAVLRATRRATSSPPPA